MDRLFEVPWNLYLIFVFVSVVFMLSFLFAGIAFDMQSIV